MNKVLDKFDIEAEAEARAITEHRQFIPQVPLGRDTAQGRRIRRYAPCDIKKNGWLESQMRKQRQQENSYTFRL